MINWVVISFFLHCLMKFVYTWYRKIKIKDFKQKIKAKNGNNFNLKLKSVYIY